jgi:hypothetical protein
MPEATASMSKGRRIALFIFAALMIVFGLAEVATGFRHKFFMISTDPTLVSTVGGVLIGAFYAASGVLVFTMRRWAMILCVVFLGIVVLGRISLVATGLYPLGDFLQIFAIVVGTSIACFFAIYVGLQINRFR